MSPIFVLDRIEESGTIIDRDGHGRLKSVKNEQTSADVPAVIYLGHLLRILIFLQRSCWKILT